ncbi:hypothetical protein GUY44_07065 [Pimelobacter simplex]|uniref:Uncharacterized protein n=1 Tax=Nocardioides simplex TaxID=2045 RepID=A0A0A1DM93_NOCSI|nr:hypothetical protein [Pimelobacter simplex]AIY17767.1 hypothetical protein KR76_15160 [Pimelobacter simplex]MCG8150232.1 hypothetical protein [Pimelobacter simplex]GEB13558.1 hypothetical protein NSI01_18730 [Pimelobacter simplex]
MTGDLERFRDHARAMADFAPGRPCSACAGNRNPWTVTTWREPDHGACTAGDCRCSCRAPSPADAELWARLADEVDAQRDRPRALCEPHPDTPAICTGEPGCDAGEHMLCCPANVDDLDHADQNRADQEDL